MEGDDISPACPEASQLENDEENAILTNDPSLADTNEQSVDHSTRQVEFSADESAKGTSQEKLDTETEISSVSERSSPTDLMDDNKGTPPSEVSTETDPIESTEKPYDEISESNHENGSSDTTQEDCTSVVSLKLLEEDEKSTGSGQSESNAGASSPYTSDTSLASHSGVAESSGSLFDCIFNSDFLHQGFLMGFKSIDFLITKSFSLSWSITQTFIIIPFLPVIFTFKLLGVFLSPNSSDQKTNGRN